jgi:class 3 adenylate cyclase
VGVQIRTEYEIQTLRDRAWTHENTFSEAQENSAFSKARQLDLRPDNEGVRLLRVITDGDDPRRERLLWISEGLDSKAVAGYPVIAKTESAPKGPPQFVPTAVAAELSIVLQANGGPHANGGAATGPATDAATFAGDEPGEPSVRDGGSDGSGLRRQMIVGFLGLLIGTALYAGVLASQSVLRKKGIVLDREVIDIAALMLAFGGFAVTLATALPKRRARRDARRQAATGAARNAAAVGTSHAAVPSSAAVAEQDGNASARTGAPAAAGLGGHQPGLRNIRMDYEGVANEFLADALERVKNHLKEATRHIAFGLNLFFAGAVKQIAVLAALDREHEIALASGTLAVLGTPAERAEKLMDDYDVYKRNHAYFEIIEAGERAAEAFAQSSDDWGPIAEKAISRWVESGNPYAEGTVVIMFTDIVGSTQMTHERGDYGAQEMVRVHNQVVRKALAEYFGKEVKHTGDGIMAVFSNAVNAIGAGMVIQQQLAINAEQNPKHAVRVRIGVNAGEAVHEEGDYFGTTVQVAARVCDKAAASELFVTEAVKMMCNGRNLPLVHVDAYELKGVDHLVDVYRVDVFARQQQAKAS